MTGWFNGDFDLSGGPPDFDDYVLIDLAFNVFSQGGGGGENMTSGTGGSTWAQVAQLDHFSQAYKDFLIAEMAMRGIYLTDADFYPGGGES